MRRTVAFLVFALLLGLGLAGSAFAAPAGKPPRWVMQKIQAKFPAKEAGGYDRFYRPRVVAKTASGGYVVSGSPADNGVKTLLVNRKGPVQVGRELLFGKASATQKTALYWSRGGTQKGYLVVGGLARKEDPRWFPVLTRSGKNIRVGVQVDDGSGPLKKVLVPITGHDTLGAPRVETR